MVSKKRLDCEFNGYQAPFIPRAPRSIRRRGPHKKLVDDSKLCAFELLAAVAGKLLQESESSASSNVAEEKIHLGICRDGNERSKRKDDKTCKSESYEHGSCAESAFVPEISAQDCRILSSFNGLPQEGDGSVVEHASVHASAVLKKVDSDVKLGICEDNNSAENTTCKVGSPVCPVNSFNHKVESGPETPSEDDKHLIGDMYMAEASTLRDPNEECVNTNVLINSESSVQLPSYRRTIPGDSLRNRWNNVSLGIRDDDENSFGCNKSSTKVRLSRPPSQIGYRRIRKTMASKYWKVAPKLKDCEFYNNSETMKSFYWYRKGIYAQERCQRVPIKKRKLSNHSFAAAYDQDASSYSISNFSEKGMSEDKNSSAVVFHRANGASATVNDHSKAADSHVKFSIKSFKVPELYIEVPETATVGSLKRTVMEAVAAILGGGIRVGVVLQGKKVRDDHRTLQQAGISECTNLDNLGFTLEPSFTHVSPSMTPKEAPVDLPSDADKQLPRSPATPIIDSGISNPSIDPPPALPVTKFDDDVDKNAFISSPKTPSNDQLDRAVPHAVSDSKALVPFPQTKAEALAVVPLEQKPKRTEVSQRRTRRPFSVAEVEALVAAVEKLGTGRWRDVKMCSFENADHRTYVDLKDKWKTLVHTASISPQQRRGEPVPQELLNRVLSAHSYWSQHQSKQHGKHLLEPMKIVDAREEIVKA